MLAKYILLPLSLGTLPFALAQPKSVIEIVGALRSDVDALKQQQPGSVQNQSPTFQNIVFTPGVGTFRNPAGTNVTVLGAGNDGSGGIWLSNRAGKTIFAATGLGEAGLMDIGNAAGDARVRLTQQSSGGGVGRFFNQTGKEVATFGSSIQGGGGGWFYNTAGVNVGFIGLGTNDKARLSLANPNGQPFAVMENSGEQAGGSLKLYTSAGKTAVSLGNSSEEGGGLWIYGEKGDLVASLTEARNVPGTGSMYIKQGQDYAELFDIAERTGLEPGSVVSAAKTGDGIALSDGAYDPKVVGVLSGAGSLHPAMAVGSRSDGTLDHAVAIAGQVYVRVSVEGGAIVPGDLLVASSTPGVAMRASDRTRAFGSVVGKALERFEGPENGLVRMLVLNH